MAAARAGALGILDVADPAGAEARRDLDVVVARAPRAAVRVAPRHLGAAAPLHVPGSIETLVVAGLPDPGSGRWRTAWPGRRLLAEVTSLAEAREAGAAGVDGLVATGSECGGRIGDTESFVLLQQVARLGLPFWVRGGVGLHTAAAAVAAGASGVVLDAQLALVRECDLPPATRDAVRAMDGSETRVVGGHRVYTRPDLPAARVAADAPPAEVAARLGDDVRRHLLPMGQDGAVAATLAERYVTVGGVVTAVERQIADQLAAARATTPLAPGHGVAVSHGTRYPVVQGPMTRVSDRSAFAGAVADAGGLPFLALALMDGPQVRSLLGEVGARLGERPWGVGVLGFVPPELREEQLEAICAARPPLALVAGGRPSQAAPLEAEGIRTYLHAPSPGLIDAFARAGWRRFVFEGRECGGHVGPRSSLVLWEAAVDRLARIDDPERLDLLFAGGIHDERSAAAVAATAAPLVARGARIGVLMGTGYLFTAEAVSHGAITPAFQEEALACQRTALLQTGPGHATRCAPTPYVTAFTEARARLEASGTEPQEVWQELEQLNLGRLRLASRGLRRVGAELRAVDEDEQRREGMFMLGQVAALRDEVTTVAELHASVTSGATARLAAATGPGAGRAAQVHEPPRRLDVAVVGMGAVMPGARDVEEFWANVVAGIDAVGEVPPGRWDPDLYYDPAAVTVDAGRRTPSKWGGFIPAVGFDALAYGLPPASLGAVEAVQLLALEVAARALADAGYATRVFDRSRASVIFGAEAGNDLSAAYNLRALLPSYLPPAEGARRGRLPGTLDAHLPELTEDSFPGVLANVIAGRIANRLDLGGVNYTVDAACASSLAALDLACKELVSGASDLVLCGGADLHNGINDFLLFASVHALSPGGRCRPFDAAADGIALGEGVACVALKRLADAERDGDRVYAVVEAVGGASDGRALGLTAPRAEGQRRALARAYAQAGCSPATLGLVEAHGTGTVVGDATELATLTELFAAEGAAPASCVLGSVKSQIGHTKCAAGLAGLIKAARSVYHGVLPPTIGLAEPNPGYDEGTSPFAFVEGARPWAEGQRRAGVSAFGFGGTNFHAVVSSYDGDEGPSHGVGVWPAELFLFRAPDPDGGRAAVEALEALVDAIVAADPTGERHRLADLARTVCEAGEGPVQVALVAADLAELRRQLAAVRRGEATGHDGAFVAPAVPWADGAPPAVALLFPGQGSQRVGMLADLFVAFPSLRRHLRAGAAWLPSVYPPRAFGPDARRQQAAALTDTRVAQPALGIVDLALADLLGQVGVVPSAVAGHSYGELVALSVAGAFDADTLLELSAARGHAVHEAATAAGDPGGMAAVAAPAAHLRSHLARHPEVVVANDNSPRQTVVAGPTGPVEALVAELRDDGVTARRLPVACAFHSPVVAGAHEVLAARLASTPVAPPVLPVWSNATASPYPGDPEEVRRLLALQVARPVRFAEQVDAMYGSGARVFVEAGPGRVLTGLVGDVVGDRPHLAVACDGGGHGVRSFLLALARLAVHGVDVDPTVLFADRARCLDLATVPRRRPGWTVDGQMVRTAAGEPVDGGLRPATENPVLGVEAAENRSPAPLHGEGATAEVVAEYLRGLRDTVAAERDVMLRFLDGAAGPAADRAAGDGRLGAAGDDGIAG
ncbi:MAG TPA: beta-ketoacyl synthase N-terminal-like domain-containing protein, partial [Acidimicrobiales bacterium]|nr:beta-ketoacyl synthase N-terminal-like domain-containing protein [Acidimicrobiales bacterium]